MIYEQFPLPWQVRYFRRCDEWHEKSSPYIVSANGETVCEMPQRVGHPGAYDPVADELAHAIVSAIGTTLPAP